MTTLALVGAGRWGSHYLRAVKKVNDCQLPYIAIHHDEPAIGEKSSYRFVRDFRELVQCKDIDGIIIATPASSHFEIAKYFLKRNIHLLIEKPMTTSNRQALELQKIYKKSSAVIHVGHIYLHNPAFDALRKEVSTIGKLKYILCESGNFGPFRRDVSALWDWGAHDVSMVLSLVGRLPISVAAWSLGSCNRQQSSDIFFIRMVFTNDVQAFISSGNLLPEKRRRIMAVGARDSIMFDDLVEKKVTRVNSKNGQRSYPFYEKEEPLVRQLRAFVSAIQNHKRDKNFAQNLDIIRVLQAAQQSMRHEGKTIPLS